MKSVAQFLAIVGLAASVIVMQSHEPAFAQQQNSKEPPDAKTPSAPQSHSISPGAAVRTHCNGTCMCTAKDCTADWFKANCGGKQTCSGTGGAGEADMICTCVRK
jgi:hypothetical protein